MHRLLIIAAALATGACGSGSTTEGLAAETVTSVETASVPGYLWTAGECPGFTPSMTPYSLPLDEGSVVNSFDLETMLLMEGLPSSLVEHGFSLMDAPWLGDRPVSAFSALRNDRVPVFVSSGVVLHLFHILFDQALASVEQRYLIRDLDILSSHLYALALERDDELSAAYFAVGCSILDDAFVPDASVSALVEAELALMADAAGFAESPIFGYEEDYGQYVPRGHYTANRRLEKYFLAAMWFGRMTFMLDGGEPFGPGAVYAVSSERAEEQTMAALAIAEDMLSDAPGEVTLADVWRRMYRVTALFAGYSDDLTPPDYLRVSGLMDGFEQGRFVALADSLFPAPAVYGGTGRAMLSPGSDGSGLTGRSRGMRLMGQRYAVDSRTLGSLVFPFVGPDVSGDLRTMPTGLDVAAMLGSAAADSLLETTGAFGFPGYTDTLAALRREVGSLSPGERRATLYSAWLGVLSMYVDDLRTGWPVFMLEREWDLARLGTLLASWATLRHDTILYVKQSYTAQVISIPPSRMQPSAGFVEPLPEMYHELAGMLGMLRGELDALGMLDDTLAARLGSAETFAMDLRDISIRELEGQPLTDEQDGMLGSLPAILLMIIDGQGDPETGSETSLIADVHTDQNTGEVLEVGSGPLDLMLVVFTRPDGQLEAAAGPVLSYYEFTAPMDGRMTDGDWRGVISSGGATRPWWTRGLIDSDPMTAPPSMMIPE